MAHIIQRGGNAAQVNQKAQHKLFVEGKDNQEIDAVVIKELLNNNELNGELSAIGVNTMGGCDNVRSAAQALIKEHPSYYFLIDRDDQNQDTVNQSWQKFPDPNEYNVLIWRKREFENYFLDLDYLEKSSFIKPRVNLKQRLIKVCNQRLFLDAANLTLYTIKRELQKPLTVKHFANHDDFKNKADGLLKLEQLSVFMDEKRLAVSNVLEKNAINTIYLNFIDELSGGILPLKYGIGTWLERMSGKEIFSIMANQCFEVKDFSGKLLTGEEQKKQIAKELVKLPLNQQPTDFQELICLLKNRIK